MRRRRGPGARLRGSRGSRRSSRARRRPAPRAARRGEVLHRVLPQRGDVDWSERVAEDDQRLGAAFEAVVPPQDLVDLVADRGAFGPRIGAGLEDVATHWKLARLTGPLLVGGRAPAARCRAAAAGGSTWPGWQGGRAR